MSASRILVIDDEPGIRAFLTFALGARGFVVDAAENGERGLELFAPGRYACVLTDLTMPGLTGDRVAAMMRESAPGVRVILMSGSDGEKSRAEEVALLGKPFTLDELYAAVEGFPVAAGAKENLS